MQFAEPLAPCPAAFALFNKRSSLQSKAEDAFSFAKLVQLLRLRTRFEARYS